MFFSLQLPLFLWFFFSFPSFSCTFVSLSIYHRLIHFWFQSNIQTLSDTVEWTENRIHSIQFQCCFLCHSRSPCSSLSAHIIFRSSKIHSTITKQSFNVQKCLSNSQHFFPLFFSSNNYWSEQKVTKKKIRSLHLTYLTQFIALSCLIKSLVKIEYPNIEMECQSKWKCVNSIWTIFCFYLNESTGKKEMKKKLNIVRSTSSWIWFEFCHQKWFSVN